MIVVVVLFVFFLFADTVADAFCPPEEMRREHKKKELYNIDYVLDFSFFFVFICY
jgi:hypothetical protein